MSSVLPQHGAIQYFSHFRTVNHSRPSGKQFHPCGRGKLFHHEPPCAAAIESVSGKDVINKNNLTTTPVITMHHHQHDFGGQDTRNNRLLVLQHVSGFCFACPEDWRSGLGGLNFATPLFLAATSARRETTHTHTHKHELQIVRYANAKTRPVFPVIKPSDTKSTWKVHKKAFFLGRKLCAASNDRWYKHK